LSPAEVHRLFPRISAPWWLAGGYSIELALGRPLRDHGDIDVLLLRRDQGAVQHALSGWE
jgi:aminoglycoside-2''-adenylyltransferase